MTWTTFSAPTGAYRPVLAAARETGRRAGAPAGLAGLAVRDSGYGSARVREWLFVL
jgi:hypothetical protein